MKMQLHVLNKLINKYNKMGVGREFFEVGWVWEAKNGNRIDTVGPNEVIVDHYSLGNLIKTHLTLQVALNNIYLWRPYHEFLYFT